MKKALIKARLKRQYLRWLELTDMSCGLSIARTIRPDIGDCERKMGELARKLRALGEDVPRVPGEKRI